MKMQYKCKKLRKIQIVVFVADLNYGIEKGLMDITSLPELESLSLFTFDCITDNVISNMLN